MFDESKPLNAPPRRNVQIWTARMYKLLKAIDDYLHRNCNAFLRGRDNVINRRERAMQMMAEDFYRLVPEMSEVACSPHALVMRYEGYAMQERRPPLPTIERIENDHYQCSLSEYGLRNCDRPDLAKKHLSGGGEN